MLDQSYDSKTVEAKWYKLWEDSGAFEPENDPKKTPYCIMMPPPNVTGVLHIGHALTFTLQDILIRYHRMQGKDVLWQPGTDHAGIATQMVVERELAKEGQSRRTLGRDKFVERVWEWKAQSGGIISTQLRRLGASPAWSRERFTMDDGLSRAVRKVFVDLYREGLIYRDKRLVNWDPKLQTAISDLEVIQKPTKSKFYHIVYMIPGAQTSITVATTRPETLFGDTAIAVNPDDERYAHLIGKTAIVPIVGREIPIIADDYTDPEKGTGAVKITPAHDYNDFEVAKRHNLERINILDSEGALNYNTPEGYKGLDREVARTKIVQDLEEQGLLAKVDELDNMVPYGDRSDVVIEPWLTDQWYVDAKTLAGPAIDAVSSGRINFYPKHWENTYFNWMRNIEPWCISRQLWWGHQIPVWYGPDNEIFVAETEDEAHKLALVHYGREVILKQDQDVLDTWFSSALWPFSTLGWPEETPEIKRFFPTNVLDTASDIIFFWVARMVMMSLHFMKDVPFKDVYIHALVRDALGQKMSKSKGNVMDPLILMDTYGTDALRFNLASDSAQGRDLKLSESKIAGSRNFVTKIWNIARFSQMNKCAWDPDLDVNACAESINQWILTELELVKAEVTSALETYKFNEAASTLYQFTWDIFCDWYIELSKPILSDGAPEAQHEVRSVTSHVFNVLLHLMHPLMPFVTEELRDKMGFGGDLSLLIKSPWPQPAPLPASYKPASNDINWVIRFIREIRAARAEMNVPAGLHIAVFVEDYNAQTADRIGHYESILKRLARLETITLNTQKTSTKKAISCLLDEATLILPLEGIIDLDQEKARLKKSIEKVEETYSKIKQKLANVDFVSRAPEEVVEEQKELMMEAKAQKERFLAALEKLI